VSTVAFHVTATYNRASITQHGLDSRHWLGQPGVAGPDGPSEHCVFLARDDYEVEYFVSMSRRFLSSVDVWEVAIPEDFDLDAEESPPGTPYRVIDGYLCTTEPIAPARLRLLRKSV
jgi:hypothetical protein